MIQLNGTAATKLRDSLKSHWLNGEITLKQIETRLEKKELPMWLQSQIVEMVNFRQYDRETCPVEQAMFGSVCGIIINEIIE